MGLHPCSQVGCNYCYYCYYVLIITINPCTSQSCLLITLHNLDKGPESSTHITDSASSLDFHELGQDSASIPSTSEQTSQSSVFHLF